MGYINVEATHHGEYIPHKGNLLKLLKDVPEEVMFYSIELFSTYSGTALELEDLPGTILSVRGPGGGKPNKWYATVRFQGGKVVAS